MSIWQVQDAKARFSELLDAALESGPQIVTRRGSEAAVLVPIEQWRRLQSQVRRSAKEVLLGSGPRFEAIAPSRGRSRRRPIITFK
ncbi:MAG: type II toxin-antitoxin system Phd/YefM family antitoxin [Terriglobales bacterium]